MTALLRRTHATVPCSPQGTATMDSPRSQPMLTPVCGGPSTPAWARQLELAARAQWPERARLAQQPELAAAARTELARQGDAAGAGSPGLITIESARMKIGAVGHSCSIRDPEVSFGKRSFLPNENPMVSTCVGTKEDVVPCRRNNFFDSASLSSLISRICHHFADVASHLMKMETTINVPLGLP
jgi:hypothetical protein